MKFQLENGRTYCEVSPEHVEQLSTWLDAVIVAADPPEIMPKDALEFLENPANIRRLGNISIQTYFTKSVKPEYMFLGETTDTDTDNGIQIYTPPTDLLPGQYNTGYHVYLDDPTHASDRNTGQYNMSFLLSDEPHTQQELSIALPVRQEIAKPREYCDEFQYNIIESEGRLYAAHRCSMTDVVKGRFPFHPLTDKRALLEPFDVQVGVISTILGIAMPDFLDVER
jgi:hypothetical protein